MNTDGVSLKDDYNADIEKVKETMAVGASPRRYICEVHRELYDIAIDLPGSVKDRFVDLLAEAYWMGKKISDRLKELKAEWDEGDWESNENFRQDLYDRAARKNLLKNIKSIQIQTLDACNRKCDWCPNSKMDKKPEAMTFETLNRILRQLMDYNYTGDIHPFLMNEPLLDKKMPEILTNIKCYLPGSKIRIITNGDFLKTSNDVDELLQAGAHSIHVNHYDGDLSDKGKLRDADFPEVTHFGMKALLPTFNNRAGLVNYEPVNKVQRCDWFLNKLFFRANGDLILCCADYKYEVVFGNINERALDGILNSDLYKKYYYAHKEGKGHTLPVCERCNRLENTINHS